MQFLLVDDDGVVIKIIRPDDRISSLVKSLKIMGYKLRIRIIC